MYRTTTPNVCIHEDCGSDDDLEGTTLSTVVGSRVHPDNGRYFLGRMDVLCPYCLALYWIDEQLSSSRA